MLLIRDSDIAVPCTHASIELNMRCFETKSIMIIKRRHDQRAIDVMIWKRLLLEFLGFHAEAKNHIEISNNEMSYEARVIPKSKIPQDHHSDDDVTHFRTFTRKFSTNITIWIDALGERFLCASKVPRMRN